MKAFPYDINCDLGEELAIETRIMPHVQSANIACGAHAGNDTTIKECIRLAQVNNVNIGIHPSYPDRENFGRRVLDIPIEALLQSLKNQIDNFMQIAKQENAKIHHLKFHGALYNQVAKDLNLTKAIINFLIPYPKEWIVFCQPNSIFNKLLLENRRKTWSEAFLDRAYYADGSLVERKRKGAILETKELVFARLKNLVQKHRILTIDNKPLVLSAQTFCIHGDHKNSVEILKFIKDKWRNGEL